MVAIQQLLRSLSLSLSLSLIIVGVLTASSRLINGQADADEHWTLNQRMPLAGETAIRGNEDAQGTTLRENFPPLTNTQDSTRMLSVET